MACSKFEYVKAFERHDTLLQNTYIVVRIDGHGFHRFTKEHEFAKPNDERSLKLANLAAITCLDHFKDIVFAYGQSDEYSFVLPRSCNLYKRRADKISSMICSLFTSAYVFNWNKYFPDLTLLYPPSFDSRCVSYPSYQNIRDYLSWRQADCHINNLYNTTFWAIVLDKKNPKSEQEAERILKDTDSGAKNELLFSTYDINYNTIDPLYRKGSVIYRKPTEVTTVSSRDNVTKVTRTKLVIQVTHVDIIGDDFWDENPHILV